MLKMADNSILRQIESLIGVELVDLADPTRTQFINNVNGYISDSTGAVTKLAIRKLTQSKFDQLAFLLRQLKKLSYIDIASSRITRLDPLESLNQVTGLRFSFNSELDESEINKLPQLAELEITSPGSGYEKIVSLSNLTRLTYLRVQGGQIRIDFSSVKYLRDLVELWLGKASISDISPLKGLKKLESLYLFDNSIVDISPLGSLRALKTIHLSNNEIVNIDPINRLENIEKLELYENRISKACLENLNQLEHLNLSRNHISEASFKNLNQLKHIDLSYNNIKTIELLNLDQASTFRAPGNQIEDVHPLQECPMLRVLDVPSNRISNIECLKGA